MITREPQPALPTVPDAASEAGVEPDRSLVPQAVEPDGPTSSPLTRRTFLRGAAVAGAATVAATVAACAPAGAPSWTFGPTFDPNAGASPSPSPAGSAAPSAAPSASAAASAAPSPSPAVTLPAGWSDHDLKAQEKVRRFVGNLSGPLGLSAFLDDPLGPPTEDPEFTKVPHGNQPLEPTLDGDVKVFDMTIDEIEWQIDAVMPPLKALGYNKMWPGPLLRVVEGDKVRVNFTNNLTETTGVHFHGIEFTDFKQDGIPFVTQLPIVPGETFTYEFVARTPGSHMYHSHHNATDQVGRGLLGAFIVDPVDPADRPAQKYGIAKPEHDVVFIHNDALGGFTINGHGFPATVPIVANVGDTIYIRYMNEGTMMHPWHTHGFRQRIVARDGAPLGDAEFFADTLGVNPGERWDAVVECDRPGVWAFHCHILPHVEGLDGMFGMVTAIVVLPA
jgi:FtsP/CotA-like multicopper oxidase with cupredoxin domain